MNTHTNKRSRGSERREDLVGEMSRRVPDLDNSPAGNHYSSSSLPQPSAPLILMSEHELAELILKNGQLIPHGLRYPGFLNYTSPAPARAWDKPPAGPTGGMLQSVVDLATRADQDPLHQLSSSASKDMPVPCSSQRAVPADCTTVVGMRSSVESNSACRRRKRGRNEAAAAVPRRSWWSQPESTLLTTPNTCADDKGFTTTRDGADHGAASIDASLISGRRPTDTIDHDSLGHSKRSQDGAGEEEEKGSKGDSGRASSMSSKRSRAAAVHNECERRRRDKINQRMKDLQKLVPHSSKADKASMLDEAIEYLKNLQSQVQMLSSLTSLLMLPLRMPPAPAPAFQVSMMAQMAQLAQMSNMGTLDLNSLCMPPGMPAPGLSPPAFLPLAVGSSWDHHRLQQPAASIPILPDSLHNNVPSCQPQRVSMDAFSRMAALYQQLYHQPPPANPKI